MRLKFGYQQVVFPTFADLRTRLGPLSHPKAFTMPAHLLVCSCAVTILIL